MTQQPIKKNKIELSDYNYQRDIKNRLIMAKLTVFEVEVIKEILNLSLKFPLSHLVESLDIEEKNIIPILEKLSETKLFQYKDRMVFVDKEMRKYYEAQIVKFDEDFEPGMEFLQGLLNHVSIYTLPIWYSISRTSDHIFTSIIEKYLLTPKIYERYLEELTFEEPIFYSIYRDVFNAPNFKVKSEELIKKYSLTHEYFEKIMLVLEFSFVCCIGYQKNGEAWEEIVTPFHEWRTYQHFLRSTAPQPINPLSIHRLNLSDFGFAKDLTALLKKIKSAPLPLQTTTPPRNGYTLPEEVIVEIFPHLDPNTNQAKSYIKRLINKGTCLELFEISNGALTAKSYGAVWLSLSIQDQAHALYRLPLQADGEVIKFSDRDIREIEKNLRKVFNNGWIYLETFIDSMTAHVGNSELITLKNKGKHWKYALPSYSIDEKTLIEMVICEKLLDAGMVSIGVCQNKTCFTVTAFGRMSIGE